MKYLRIVRRMACLILAGFAASAAPATAEGVLAPVPSRIVAPANDHDLALLAGNTHPEAVPQNDLGLANPGQQLQNMHLVLQRSAEQERALAALHESQYDPFSPNYHRWLHAEEFGRTFGPSDADIAEVTRWLRSQGLQVLEVGAGRISISFTGSVARVQKAFHVEMHRYLVDGEEHLANDRDPQIPQALAPVVTGVAALHDFRARPQMARGLDVARDLLTGLTTALPAQVELEPMPGEFGPATRPTASSIESARSIESPTASPQLGFTYNGLVREDVTPLDFAAIYNLLPLWKESTPINGTGVTVAIAGGSDIILSDLVNFRKIFGLPPKTLTVIHNGADPGFQVDQQENTLDVEMVSAAAPGANITLVVTPASGNAFLGSATYIVNHEVAPIMSLSYGVCELNMGTSLNALVNSVWQQGAAEGISIFVSSGDQGAAGCSHDNQKAPTPDTEGTQVNGFASSPYVTAVGGTDFLWEYLSSGQSKYWNPANVNGGSAKGYIPEQAWNGTCTNPLLLLNFTSTGGAPLYANSEALCNGLLTYAGGKFKDLINIWGGSGGVSRCTTPTGTTPATCKGGYAKPSWQTGTGVPNDGKRDLPDLALYSSAWILANSPNFGGSAIVMCYSGAPSHNACTFTTPTSAVLQEVGGTSAASPFMAGVMALVLQKTGARQGLANPAFYKLEAKENLGTCGSDNVTISSTCIFHDVTNGSIAMACTPGDPNCTTTVSGHKYGILNGYSATAGYDLATGLGSINALNLVNDWTTVAPTPTVSISPSSIAFPTTKAGSTSAAKVITVKNTGKVAVTLFSNGITFSGTNATSFIKTATTCTTTLVVGGSCTISVAFKPTVAGSLTAKLALDDNASGGPQTVSLTGTGN